MKMAAVFMFVTSTIGLRTAVLSRWVSCVGFTCALVLLLTITDVPWISLLFPFWVLTVSMFILVADFSKDRPKKDFSATPLSPCGRGQGEG
jgi:hypothetical protein